MTLRRRLAFALVILALIIAAGTVGFMVTEGMTVLDALWYTFVTITTVGYREPGSGFSGPGRLTATVLMVAGLGTIFFVATAGLEVFINDLLGGRLTERARKRRISRMTGHVVLCGYGRIGRTAFRHLTDLGRDVIVIDSNHVRAEAAENAGAAVVVGDATNDEALRQAGVDRAEVLVAAVEKDSDNIAIILSARALAPGLRIIARASEPVNEQKLRLAGADRVVSPVTVGAERLAAMAAEADIADYVDITFEGDLVELRVEECHLATDSPLVGVSLGESNIRTDSGAMVVAIRHKDGRVDLNPPAAVRLTAGATVVGIGTDEQLTALHRIVG